MFAVTVSILCAAAMATAITKEMMIAAVSLSQLLRAMGLLLEGVVGSATLSQSRRVATL
jgi:hypothetical protein